MERQSLSLSLWLASKWSATKAYLRASCCPWLQNGETFRQTPLRLANCPSRSLSLSLALCVDHLGIIPTERPVEPCTTLCLALSSSDLESRHYILSMRLCGPMPHIMWFDYFLHVKLSSWPGNTYCWRNWSKRMIMEVILTGGWSASHEDMWGLMSPPNVPDHQEITCAANYRH